jgi:outer membrane protein TolC
LPSKSESSPALQLREAQQQEAAIVYKHTVLEAWREVDDALAVYDAEQRRRDRRPQWPP